MTTEELLERLPRMVALPGANLADEEDTDYKYWFDMEKCDKGYYLSYFNYMDEMELKSFCGPLREVVAKMYDWCKANNLLEE